MKLHILVVFRISWRSWLLGYKLLFSVGVFITIIFCETLQATQEYGDRDKIMQVLEKHGGICDCQSSRYMLIFF